MTDLAHFLGIPQWVVWMLVGSAIWHMIFAGK